MTTGLFARYAHRVSGVETTLDDVYWYLDLFDILRIDVWIDGGWGVDALLGGQTRPHEDLDIIIEKSNSDLLRLELQRSGHVDIPQDDTRAWNFVMGEPGVRLIDFHVIVFDESGAGIYGPPENGQMLPASAFTGQGSIGGKEVRCMSAEYQVSSHTGYPLTQQDLADVRALHERFGVPLESIHKKLLQDL
jgi:lincosamide nucleotidyltransferase A/C/D/E